MRLTFLLALLLRALTATCIFHFSMTDFDSMKPSSTHDFCGWVFVFKPLYGIFICVSVSMNANLKSSSDHILLDTSVATHKNYSNSLFCCENFSLVFFCFQICWQTNHVEFLVESCALAPSVKGKKETQSATERTNEFIFFVQRPNFVALLHFL